MGDKLKGYYFRAKSKMKNMKDKRKDRQSEKDQERFLQQQMEKEKLRALVIEQELNMKKNPKPKKLSDDQVEMQIEAEINAKLDKWGRYRNLPDWAIKQMKEQVIADQRARIYRNDLEEAKEELLNKYATQHWIVSGKCAPKLREDDLLCTPYPFARSQISLSDLKKGSKRETPVVILKSIKSERGEIDLTKERKREKSSPVSMPDTKVRKSIGKSSLSGNYQAAATKTGGKPVVSKKPTQQLQPEDNLNIVAPPATSDGHVTKGDGDEFEKCMENKGSMGHMIKFLFEEETIEGDKSPPVGPGAKERQPEILTSEEDETYCDNVTEMNTMVNRALTQLGPGDLSPSEIRLKTIGKGNPGKQVKAKFTPPEWIRLKFKEDVTVREYWYANETEADKKKTLKPSVT